MGAVLRTEGLCLSFGAVVAAVDINIAVGDQEVVGIIGANGAGKTTFVNMVTGYLKPSAGHIFYRGRDITPLSPRQITRLGVCRSFQIPQLFMELPVIDNVLVALGVATRSGRRLLDPLKDDETVSAAARVLDRYGLAEYRNQHAAMLPHGTRKLLDIAMTTVAAPSLVLLDEPTSGISIDEKFAVMDTLMQALREHDVTVLFVEHDMEIVARYGERVIAFYDGQVIADGAPQAVLDDGDVRRLIVGAELRRRG